MICISEFKFLKNYSFIFIFFFQSAPLLFGLSAMKLKPTGCLSPTVLYSSHCGSNRMLVCVYAQLYVTLCNAKDIAPPGSSVYGTFQARILEQIAISYSRGSSPSRDQNHISCISSIDRQILYHCATWEAPNIPSSNHIPEASYTVFPI